MAGKNGITLETQNIVNALAKENNLSGLKKRGLYAHLLKTELSSSPEGSNIGGGQSISGGIGVGSRQGKPGYRVQLKQLKSLRKKDDIIYERDTYVPLKSKGISETDKDDLIYQLAFGCDRPKTPEMNERIMSAPKGPKDASSKAMEDARHNQLIQEISERMEFLETMEGMGRTQSSSGTDYNSIIKQEIAAKLKELKSYK